MSVASRESSGGSASEHEITDDHLIQLIATNTGSTLTRRLFIATVAQEPSFRQRVKEWKEKYRSEGFAENADRLNAAMVMVLFKGVDRSAESSVQDDASVDSHEDDDFFWDVADGTASDAQRDQFRDRLLDDEEFHRRVSCTQKRWASMQSDEAQNRSLQLLRVLMVCDLIRKEMAQRPLEAASEAGPSRPQHIGGTAEASRQERRRQARVMSPAHPGSSSGATSIRAPEGEGLIDIIASNQVTSTQIQDFVWEATNNSHFQNLVKKRDREWRSLGTKEAYKKAQVVRIALATHVNVNWSAILPPDPVMEEACAFANTEEQRRRMVDTYRDGCRELVATAVGEARATQSHSRTNRSAPRAGAPPTRPRAVAVASPVAAIVNATMRETVVPARPTTAAAVMAKVDQAGASLTGLIAERAAARAPRASTSPPSRIAPETVGGTPYVGQSSIVSSATMEQLHRSLRGARVTRDEAGGSTQQQGPDPNTKQKSKKQKSTKKKSRT